MKKCIFLFCSLFMLTIISCSVDDDYTSTSNDGEIELRDTPTTYDNPNGIVYNIYYASVFCADGSQTQIWADDYDVCDCLLQESTWSCYQNGGEFLEGTSLVCEQTTSQIPPVDKYCSK